MKKDQLNNPIIITGAARSGTSMIAGIIHLCGAFGGEFVNAKKGLAKSTFENEIILKTIVQPYLKDIGADVAGQYPLPEVNSLRIPVSWAKNVTNVLIQQGYTGGAWMYKGTAANMVYPVWHYAFPNAKWIIVRRNDNDIVNSCLQTTYMKAFDNEENIKSVGCTDKRDAWYWWVRQHNKRFAEMVEAGLNCKQIHPERMVYGDYSQIYEMLDWLGLKWNSDLLQFIEPKLGYTRKNL